MPDDYYGEAGSAGGSPADATSAQKPAANPDDESMEGETAMLPKSLFGDQDPQVGQEYLFKVEHVWEKEVEVSYAKAGADKPATNKSTMDTATDAFDSMTQGKA